MDAKIAITTGQNPGINRCNDMKTAIKIPLIIGLLIFSAFSLVPVRVTSTEYLYLTGGGESMFPTILEGDTVKVKLCTDGDLIKAGHLNSSHPGDIIVYCVGAAIAYIPQPTSMWICHRVVYKYFKDGELCFTTQGDNNPEPDPWEVPEHYLLGVVVDIIHNGNTQQGTSSHRSLQPTSNIDAIKAVDNALTTITEFTLGLFIGLVVVVAIRNNIKSSRKQAFNSFCILSLDL